MRRRALLASTDSSTLALGLVATRAGLASALTVLAHDRTDDDRPLD